MKRLILSLVFLVGLGAGSVWGQRTVSEEAVDFFRGNCASCHTIGGGRLAGPDLKGVLERQEREWLARFITGPQRVIDSGDPYARKLFQEARGTVMPTLPGMSRQLADKLLDLIEVESSLPKSQFAGLVVSDRPLTAEDVAAGRDYFLGRRGFAAGAPACASCHSVLGLDALGGGTLGPDLTAAFARLEGRKALAAWLTSPPSATMQPVFRQHPLDGEEILQVVAYLKDAAASGEAAAPAHALDFLLWGIGGAALLLVTFDFLWRRRYRAVRRPLVTNGRVIS